VAETVNAGKVKLGAKDALALARAAKHVAVAKGKKVVRFDMKKDRPDDETLLGHLLGRSGTLRAPAVRAGDCLLVGFHPDAYADALS
jgi:arsenate reductase-like glutaredoxin family protein